MNENISDNEGEDSVDPFDPNVTDQDDSEEEDEVVDDQRKSDNFEFQKCKMNSVNLIIFLSISKDFFTKIVGRTGMNSKTWLILMIKNLMQVNLTQ